VVAFGAHAPSSEGSSTVSNGQHVRHQSRRPRRRGVRISLAPVIAAVVAVAAVSWLAAAPPAAAATCMYFSAGRFDATGDDATNLNGESVTIRNRCANEIYLTGWSIHDVQGNTFTFGSLRIGTGSVTLHTGSGTATSEHQYWGRSSPVWDNTPDERAFLLNANGALISTWAPDPWSIAFGTRPRSAAISLKNCHDLVIENKTFQSLGANVIAIRLDTCTNVTIRGVDFIDVAEGVYARNSTNITVVDSRYSNILGPHQRDGHNRGNFVQLDGVNGALIDHNKGKGGDTEDVVSLYRSSNVVVEDNWFEGTNWTSTSGSGIAIGDGGGSNNIARRNKLLNIGQVGIHIAGGTNNRIDSNIIYGAPRTNSNVGMYVWNQSGAPCSGVAVVNNDVRFWKASGVFSAWWHGGGCGTLTYSGNDYSTPIDPATLAVKL
jgi:hypothetical protein